MNSAFEQTLYTSIESKLPKELAVEFLAFCKSFKDAVGETQFLSLLPTLATYTHEIQKNLETPYVFSHFHKQEREPVDYFAMGRDLIRPLIDESASVLKGKKTLLEIEELLQRKENVVFLANHQTEIDPQILSLMVEPFSPTLAHEMVYIAGHRVTTDPLAVPFSRGCNLICIYSKKYIEHPPEKRAEKLQHNARSLAQIEELIHAGGVAFYVAPSGGRDRWDDSGKVQIASFDPQSVEMFRLFAKKSPIPTHFYLLTLSTINLLPPPKQLQVALGEERLPARGPVHIAFSEELHFEEPEFITDKKLLRQERADALTNQSKETYTSFFS